MSRLSRAPCLELHVSSSTAGPSTAPRHAREPLLGLRPPRCPPFVEITHSDQLMPYLEHVARRPYNHGLNACWDLKAGERVLLRVDNWHSELTIQACQREEAVVRQDPDGLWRSGAPQRVGSALELPTIAESGLPGFEVAAWDAITVPAGTPAAIVERLNGAIRKVLADSELIQQLARAGAEPTPSSPAELARFIETERERWGAAVKRSGAAVE